jgi:hypothetical protein
LELRYIEALGPAAVQEQLGIEKNQYYREHAHALAAVVAHLEVDRPGAGDDRPSIFAPPTIGPSAGRLPLRPTSFVGRELADLRPLLAGARLLTLTGAGERQQPVGGEQVDECRALALAPSPHASRRPAPAGGR